ANMDSARGNGSPLRPAVPRCATARRFLRCPWQTSAPPARASSLLIARIAIVLLGYLWDGCRRFPASVLRVGGLRGGWAHRPGPAAAPERRLCPPAVRTLTAQASGYPGRLRRRRPRMP